MKKWLVCIALCLAMALLVACNDTPPAGSGSQDSGNQDSGNQDGGSQDSGSQDSGSQDSGSQDSGSQDSGNQDSGNQDGGNQDGGNQDGGNQDGGNQDGGNQDGGNQDGGNQDGGNQDGGNQDGGDQDGEVNVENEKIKGYLKALLEGFRVDPYSYLPEKMLPSAVAVNASALAQNYTTGNVSVSSIPTGGYGEQWNMIVENLAQSEVFFEALSAVEGLTTTSVTIFNNFLDENPEATAAHSFKSGIYTVSIVYENGVLDYVLDYTADFPIVGNQTAQIALSMDVAAGEKTVRVQLGDANALRYVVSADSYEFAIRYLGVRRAYFSVARDGENAEGHIYEYLTVKGIEIASAADFYITEDYVTAVGNKADGLVGFKGYISELYDAKSGALLGYEVRETLSALTYNTLWFDLASFNGFSSIRYREANPDAEIEAAFFLNGANEAWEAKLVGGFNPLTSFTRRFDIEFRDRYFYVYNTAEEKYEKHAVKVPMIFVQENYYDSLTADIKSENGITVSSKVSASDLSMIQSEYAEKVDVFIANKENMTVDAILSFIGTKITVE